MNFIVSAVRGLGGGRVPPSALYDDIRLPRDSSGCNAKTSLHPQRLYREQGENLKHHYTQTVDFPEVLLAKLNAMNISEVKLLEGILGQRWEDRVSSWASWCPVLVPW